MRRTRCAIAVAAFALSVFQVPIALAQIPLHQPGTICLTPQFWCWANPPGPPGGGCACPSPYGWVNGRLG